MNKDLHYYFTIFGQLIAISLIFLFGVFLIYMKIPGNGALCDPELIFYAIILLVFILISASFIFNSIVNYKKRKWMKYRIIAIYSTILIILLVFSFRWLMLNFYYGNKIYSIINDGNNEKFIHVNIQLFENGKFFSKTYQNCENENIGTYIITENEILLKFNDEKPDFLGTRYLIKDDKLNCFDCDNEVKLVMKK